MIDETRLSPRLRLPTQSAPVARKPGSAGLVGSAGVEAADWLSDLLDKPIGSYMMDGFGPVSLSPFGI